MTRLTGQQQEKKEAVRTAERDLDSNPKQTNRENNSLRLVVFDRYEPEMMRPAAQLRLKKVAVRGL